MGNIECWRRYLSAAEYFSGVHVPFANNEQISACMVPWYSVNSFMLRSPLENCSLDLIMLLL